jgi:hypothetical protein
MTTYDTTIDYQIFHMIIYLVIFIYSLKTRNLSNIIMSCKRDVFILDCPEIQCPLVLIYVFQELCGYFERNSYNVRIIRTIGEITNNSIVFMGDTFRVADPVKLLKDQAPDAVYIGWYWNAIDTSALNYFIYTYENHYNFLAIDQHRIRYEQIKDKKNRCPLLLRANDSPTSIGKYERKEEMDYCYMGFPYQPQLVPGEEFKGIYYAVSDQTRYLNYGQRRDIYLRSTFALGFQGPENHLTGHVSQRIYEGMAYGCVVFSESIHAVEQTEGIVQHFKTKTDLEKKMRFFKAHPEKILELQERGYKYVREKGTNQFAVELFGDTIRDCYGFVI